MKIITLSDFKKNYTKNSKKKIKENEKVDSRQLKVVLITFVTETVAIIMIYSTFVKLSKKMKNTFEFMTKDLLITVRVHTVLRYHLCAAMIYSSICDLFFKRTFVVNGIVHFIVIK